MTCSFLCTCYYPATILAALNWHFSSAMRSWSEQSSQTIQAYSNLDLINDSYIVSKLFLSMSLDSLSIRSSSLERLSKIVATWSFQLKAELNTTPRCLCCSISSIGLPWKINGRWVLFLFENNIDLVLLGLKFSSTVTYRQVSSADIFKLHLTTSARSFMNTRKVRGPRDDPCGTPDIMSPQSENWPLMTTLCFLSVR